MYKQMIVRIEYIVHRPTAGVRFVGCEPGDNVVLYSVSPLIIAISPLIHYERHSPWFNKFVAAVY
jgi:hypothetical protein